MPKKLSNIEVINVLKAVHGGKYDYSRIVYEKPQKKLEILCKEHGSFWQTYSNHRKGKGCPRCANERQGKRQTLRREDVISRFVKKHGDTYDYSQVNYVNAKTHVTVGCPEHGPFRVAPNNHSRGHGCPKCSGPSRVDPIEAIDKLKAIHPEYDYTNAVYVGRFKSIKVKCPVHGLFEPLYNTQVVGGKCAQCVGGVRSSLDECIRDFKDVHGNTYDYSQVNYVNTKTHVTVGCPEHGRFQVTPSHHKGGQGCPKCRVSRGEILIARILENLGIKYETEKKFKGMVYKRSLRLDFYLPDHGIAIEFNGLQHYKPVESFGGQEAFKKTRNRDNAKAAYCQKNGIKLVIIPCTETNVASVIEQSLASESINSA